MFTGIVQGTATMLQVSGTKALKTLRIQFPKGSLKHVTKGASIAINGTCLTVTEFDIKTDIARFDVIEETLKLTNIGHLGKASAVNFERAAAVGDEIGGHLMSGHIHTTVRVSKIDKTPENCTLYFETPTIYHKYLLTKGFAGLNGCSLTLGKVNDTEFCVHLIPETLGVTTFKDSNIGDRVNLEIDSQTQTIVDTVERVLLSKAQ
jgi:riboflavin synthase